MPTPDRLADWELALLGDRPAQDRMDYWRRRGAEVQRELEQIDATVDGRCACGCGTVLSPGGRSGWWASEECQHRWQHWQAGTVPDAEERLIAQFEAMYCRHHAGVAEWEARNQVRIPTGFWLRSDEPARQRLCAWLEANGIDYRLVPMDADIRIGDDWIYYEVFRLLGHAGGPLRERATAPLVEPWTPPETPEPARGGVFWLPNGPADPEAPTAAELAGGIDLTPYLAPPVGPQATGDGDDPAC